MISNFSTILLQSSMPEMSGQISSGITNLGETIGLSGPVLNIIGGIALLIIGFFVAKIISKLFTKVLHKMGLDKGSSGKVSLSEFGGKLLYYLIMIIVLMAALNLMGVSGDVLSPLNTMTTSFFNAIPNIVAAGIIGYVGYVLANIVSGLVEASGDKIRELMPKVNTGSNVDVVKILKNVVFIFVFIPILIIALQKLDMTAITVPATNMLNQFMSAIPTILYAVVILMVAVIGGKFVKSMLTELLSGFNLEDLSKKLQLQNVLGNTNLVSVIANLVYIFIVYMGVSQACKILGLTEIVGVLNSVLAIAGKVFFGLIILALGNVVAKFAANIFMNSNSNKYLGSLIHGAVLMIFIAMGLSAMGIASNIIELAFGLGMGAIAVAFALAFGLGGKDAAGEEVKDFFKKFKDK